MGPSRPHRPSPIQVPEQVNAMIERFLAVNGLSQPG
jgi:hypothetical protein